MLLSTTALVLGLGSPAMLMAQTEPSSTQAEPADMMPGFMAMRGESDLYVSELIGHDVYARRTPADMAAAADQEGTDADGTAGMAMMGRADLESMDNIGQINEIILSSDGQVRAVVIGVGGFLGVGEQDVAVTMDQVTIAADPDDRSEIYVVVNTGADMLKSSPPYMRTSMAEDAPAAVAGTGSADAPATTADRTVFVAPAIERDGYSRVEATEVSTDMLVGKTVYGVNDDSVGTIDDLILDDSGAISNVIIDFGGFLGIGSSQVSVGYEELTILANEGNTDLRVYIDATKDQVQAQPQYRASN